MANQCTQQHGRTKGNVNGVAGHKANRACKQCSTGAQHNREDGGNQHGGVQNQRQAKDHGLADAEQCGANGNFGNSAIIFTLGHQEDSQADGQSHRQGNECDPEAVGDGRGRGLTSGHSSNVCSQSSSQERVTHRLDDQVAMDAQEPECTADQNDDEQTGRALECVLQRMLDGGVDPVGQVLAADLTECVAANGNTQQSEHDGDQRVEGSGDRCGHRIRHLDFELIEGHQEGEQLACQNGDQHTHEQTLRAQRCAGQATGGAGLVVHHHRNDLRADGQIGSQRHNSGDVLRHIVLLAQLEADQEHDRQGHAGQRCKVCSGEDGLQCFQCGDPLGKASRSAAQDGIEQAHERANDNERHVDGKRVLDSAKELVFIHLFGHQTHAINELVAKFTHVFSPPKGLFQTTQPLFTRSSACFRMAAPLQRP